MKNNALVTVKGLQSQAGMPFKEDEAIELMTTGTYVFEDGCHILEYEEVFEDMPGSTHNMLRTDGKSVEVHKTGQADVDMFFEPGKTSIAAYSTPYGDLNMSFAATSMNVEKKEERLSILIEYALSMNDQYVADCRLSVEADIRS